MPACRAARDPPPVSPGRTTVRENPLKARLLAGETTLGAWLMFADPFVAEAMASLGWDWLLVDMEHGPVPLADAQAMITAIRTTPVVPLVRPAWNESAQIQRVLDLGPAGIIVPVVNTAEDARQVVRDARFPPLGERSRGAVRPALAFGTDAGTYSERANDEVLVFVQIETDAAVDGIDGLFVGPNDLAASAGKRWPDVWERDEVYMRAIEAIPRIARQAGKIAGILARDAAMAKRCAQLGYGFIGVSSDIGYLMGAAKREHEAARREIAAR